MAEHLAAANLVNPTDALLNVTLTPLVKEICADALNLPQAVIKRRASALESLTAVSDSLAQRRLSWVGAIPKDSPAKNLNFPLIHCLVRTFGYEDHALTYDLPRGMPIAGKILPSGTLPARERPAAKIF